MLSLLSGRKVALPPPFCLSQDMHLAATSSSVTTMLLRPAPRALASASSCDGSFGAVNSPSEPSIPFTSPLWRSLVSAANVTAEPGVLARPSWRARALFNPLSASLTLISERFLSSTSSPSCFCSRRSSSANELRSVGGWSPCRSSPTSSRSSRTIVASSNSSSRSANLLEAIWEVCSARSEFNLASA